MKKRIALGLVTAVLVAGCSSPSVSTQMGLHAQMESGPAINSTNGRYHAGTADIALANSTNDSDAESGDSTEDSSASIFTGLNATGTLEVF